jgi:hypothetical protein
MTRRVLKGRSPFAADREHFHHAFQLAGFSVFRTHVTITAMAVIFMVVGLTGQFAGAPEVAMFYLFLGVFGLYFWGMLHAWKVMRFLRRAMHLEKESIHIIAENSNSVLFKDGHVEDLRAYYLQQRAKHAADDTAPESEESKVSLKLVVNADSVNQAESNSTSTSTK